MSTETFTHDVFLSHSAKDKAVVSPLAERLRKDGLRVWFDEWEIKPGDSIPAKIEEGLEHSHVLVLCMSANAFASEWAQLEAGTFRFRDPLNKERRFISLRLDDAPIKGSLAQFLYINWLPEESKQEYAKLLQACLPSAIRLAAESQVPQKSAGESRRRLLVDQSHRQDEWHGYPTANAGYRTALQSLDGYVVTASSPGTPLSNDVLEQHSVLLLPMPFGTMVETDEYRAIAQWVYSGNGLLVLGNYLMESHHYTNFNQLVRLFSLEFSQDLVMPLNREDFRSCMHQAFGTNRELHTVATPIVNRPNHPVLSGVRWVAFQSSCTVLSRQDAELSVSTSESFSVMKAIGPKNESGKILQIQDYVLDKRAQVCFMAGTFHGRGRVLAIGSWKILLNEFTEDGSLDNCRLFRNAISWLASSG